jgi:hypothetical protein
VFRTKGPLFPSGLFVHQQSYDLLFEIMSTQQWWKDFYANERSALGRPHLVQLIRDAPSIGSHRALIFPHTYLSASGHQTAAVAKAIVSGGYEHVLALGVLHGRDRKNESSRGIYTERDAITADEFSLDNLEILINVAADMSGVRPPLVIKRYPLLTQGDPTTLEGYDELLTLQQQGAALVATGDLIHHGTGYGTAPEDARELDSQETMQWATQSIQEHIDALLLRDFRKFEEQCDRLRSDFRDVGPVLSSLLGNGAAELQDLRLIDYSDVLEAPAPTWVAAALIAMNS